MCSTYELLTNFCDLPLILKKELPYDFKANYQPQSLVRPSDPVLVLRNEGKITTSIMLWGFVSSWSTNPMSVIRPYNARAETVNTKKLFRGSWQHKRCLLPASAFFEKGCRVARADSRAFWLGGIWNRWIGKDGSELECCCVLTTEPNDLLKSLHNRMPVIIPNGCEEDWIACTKNNFDLKELEPLLGSWPSDGWIIQTPNKNVNSQLSLF